MSEYFKNDFTKSFSDLVAFQTELAKQATEVNKKVVLELLKNTKAAVDAFSRNVDSEIKRLEVNPQ